MSEDNCNARDGVSESHQSKLSSTLAINTLLLWKPLNGESDKLHKIMLKRNHFTFQQTLTELINEEIGRMSNGNPRL